MFNLDAITNGNAITNGDAITKITIKMTTYSRSSIQNVNNQRFWIRRKKHLKT